MPSPARYVHVADVAFPDRCVELRPANATNRPSERPFPPSVLHCLLRILFHMPLSTRSVRAANGAIPDLCVEIRGYEAIDAPGEEYGYQDVDNIAKGPPVVHRSHSWWSGSDEVQPRFVHMQRTSSPNGEFAFVTPESEVVFAVAVYAHGGDYPSAIRMFPRRHGRHASPTREATAHDMCISESGRVDMNISLVAERMEASELLWSLSARENDDSPCARRHAASGAGEKPMPRHQQNTLPSLIIRTSYDKYAEAAQRLSFLQNPNDVHSPMDACDSPLSSTTPSACAEDHSHSVISAVENAVLVMLHFRSLCWNYGQHNAAFWEDNPAVCSLFRSASEAPSAKTDMATDTSRKWGTYEGRKYLQRKTHIGMSWNKMRWRQLSSSTDAWRGFLVLVGFGIVVLCFVLPRQRTPTHPNTLDDDDHVCIPAAATRSFQQCLSTSPASGDPTSFVDAMVGTIYSSDGRVSQVALESTHRHAQGVPRQTPRTRRRLNGKDAGHQIEKHQEDDEFSSMFRALGGATLCNVQQKGRDISGTNWLGNVMVTQEG